MAFYSGWKKVRVIDMPILKTKIHELRKENNMQQAELAKLVGVRRETIGNLENGKYNPSLCACMGVRDLCRWNCKKILLPRKKLLCAGGKK